MLELASPVLDLPRVGPAKAKFLAKLGIKHIRDLLFLFPRRYDDFSKITPIAKLAVSERMTVKGQVKSIKSNWGFRGRQRLLRIFVEIEDETGVLSVMWFNLRFLEKQLWPGRPVLIAGVVEIDKKDPRKRVMRSPVLEFGDDTQDTTHTARITPVYPETFGVTSRWLRYQIKNMLPLVQTIPEYLPEDIRKRQKLMGIHEALQAVHFPDNSDHLAKAQQRLRFDELFFLQLAALVRRQRLQKSPAPEITIADADYKRAVSELPFKLTKAQSRALADIRADLKQPHPMNRLLQGDVGSGKSAVALVATRIALAAGYHILYLAPTEILARQQAVSFQAQLGKETVKFLAGSLSLREKSRIKEQLKKKTPLVVVGTHALLQEDVVAPYLGLAIVDEQHRFGVTQRLTLTKTTGTAMRPHLLSMTATPIPRTLTLTVYGDLDVSVLDELPPGRQPTETTIVPPGQRDATIIFILEQLHKGRQAFVIAPLVEKSDKLEVRSATETYEEMKQLFPGIAIGLVHGRLPADEKEAVMRNFAAGALQLLVATAVVEVGVDVPNAACMIIEGAERFGLAQLHQFRGRIGRGEHKSYCYLFPTTVEASSSPRLTTLAATTDGFRIAEADLTLRGPGEVYGVAQSGFSDLKVASLLDYGTIRAARQEAEGLLKTDTDLLQHTLLRRKVEQKNTQTHFE